MTNDTPKEWNPEYKTETELISEQVGGFTQQGFLVNNQQKEIQIGVRNYMFHVNKEEVIIGSGATMILDKGGSIKFTTIAAPTACTATLVATSTGNVDDGNHSYKVTYITADGETDLGAESNVVTVDATHKKVNLTNIPHSNSFIVTGRKIYRTKAGGTDYYLLTTINDNVTTTYTDNTADASLSGGSANYLNNTTAGRIMLDDKPAIVFEGNNTYAGILAGSSTTTGGYNSAFGLNALRKNTTGISNTAVGMASLGNNTSGSNNVAIGSIALNSNITGNYNTAIGTEALATPQNQSNNTAIGYRALAQTTSGHDCTAVGSNALWNATTESFNTALGAYTLYNVTNHGYNTAIGSAALYKNDNNNNVALGHCAGYWETGSSKLFIDNSARQDEADGRAKALIYGIFDYSTTNQLITINGNTWIRHNCSADSFTDRTPFYEGDALKDISKIKSKQGQINHTTLPEFVKSEIKHEDGTIEQGRDLGKMISLMTVAIQQLTNRIEVMEAKLNKQ